MYRKIMAPSPEDISKPPVLKNAKSSAPATQATTITTPVIDPLITDFDTYLFRQGNHFKLYEKFGAHPMKNARGEDGIHFAVWAPNAKRVSIVGDFNGWNVDANVCCLRTDDSGIWEGFIAGLPAGSLYKYHLESRIGRYSANRADPFAFFWEKPPSTSPIIRTLDYRWDDAAWMATRKNCNAIGEAQSIYEMHIGSWKRKSDKKDDWLSYRELAPLLADYLTGLNFTHVEFLPVMEHPFYGSWGYQTTGYFAPTSRYGTPQDFMYLVDYLHQKGIGVLLDWVPSHFPGDEHGLVYFDGTHLYEHADSREGFHPDWKSYIFNYGRGEVRSFLFSSAMFWLEKFHIDGLRVDAVASMLYRDYSRKRGEWIPNKFGGRENLEAIDFLKRLNEEVYKTFPDVQMIAEESTAWPMVSKPTYVGGLGFGMKWNMGWMHDVLYYMGKNPVHRKYHHNELTFSLLYAFTENYVLALSHDEVVHGKGSLVNKMPGDDWQRLANLRLLFTFQFTHPGKKLLFMGGEFAQWREWAHDGALDWNLTAYDRHKGIELLVRDLNTLYRTVSALHELDCDAAGFEWIDFKDWENSVISYLRKGRDPADAVLVVCNFTPVPRYKYLVGVPAAGMWKEIFNSDSALYGGSNLGNSGAVASTGKPCLGRKQSVELTLPPLGAIVFRHEKPVDGVTATGMERDRALAAPVSSPAVAPTQPAGSA
jgi:1,4-alpha-glucan branching enzyme